jgi:hypothetical protein
MITRLKQFLITIIALLLTLIILNVPSDTIDVSDQPVGASIYIKRLSLKKSGFVVIQKGEKIIAHSDFLPEGIYKNINIDPFFLSPSTQSFSPGIADIILFKDNGDNYFDPNLDTRIESGPSRQIMIYSGNETRDILEKILGKCSGGNSFDFGCFRKEVGPMITENSLGEILAQLENAFSEGSFKTRTCHGPAHVVGEEAREILPFETINSLCSRRCDYGCLHGAFSTEIGVDEQFSEKAGSYCDRFSSTGVKKDLEACYHIVGHGLSEKFRSDIEGALSVCDTFTETGRIECQRGALMEFLMGSPDNPSKKFENPDELINFCSDLPQNLNGQCFGYLGFYAYSLFGSAEAHNLCGRVPVPDMQNCFYSLGSASYFYLRDNSEELTELCNQAGKYARDCIKGAIEIFVGEEKYRKKALGLCEGSPSDFQPECKRFWCEKIKWAWGITSSCEPNSLR